MADKQQEKDREELAKAGHRLPEFHARYVDFRETQPSAEKKSGDGGSEAGDLGEGEYEGAYQGKRMTAAEAAQEIRQRRTEEIQQREEREAGEREQYAQTGEVQAAQATEQDKPRAAGKK